jgi:hypothetical protein
VSKFEDREQLARELMRAGWPDAAGVYGGALLTKIQKRLRGIETGEEARELLAAAAAGRARLESLGFEPPVEWDDRRYRERPIPPKQRPEHAALLRHIDDLNPKLRRIDRTP